MHRLCTILALLSLAGCSILDTKVDRAYDTDNGWSTFGVGTKFAAGSAFTTADVRIITERMQPVLGVPVVCVEPSPDVADALANAVALTAKGGTTTVNGDLSITGSSSEAVAELAGRSTALLGLRDGLFEACEAYANGAIGQDEYALITSVYGQLMSTLFLGQDMTSTTGGKLAAISSPSIQPQDDSGSGDGGKGKDPQSAGTTAKTSYETEPSGQPEITLASDEAGLAIQPVAAAKVPSPSSKGGLASGNATSTVDQQVQAGVGGNASTAIPLALVRMNEDYMHGGILGVLLVTCIDEYDPTRFRPGALVNLWLEGVCRKLEDPAELMKIEQAEAAVDAVEGYKAVNPTSAALATPSGGAKSQTHTGKTATTTTAKGLIVNILHMSPASDAGPRAPKSGANSSAQQPLDLKRPVLPSASAI